MPFWRAPTARCASSKVHLRATSIRLRRISTRSRSACRCSSQPPGEGTAVRSTNVTLAPLPAFDGPVHFYPRLASVLPRLLAWGRHIDLLHCRVPSPAAVFAFAIARLIRTAGVPARRRRPARAAAGDAVPRAQARTLAGVHRVRGTEHSMDGRPLAHVRERPGAVGETCAAGSSGDSKRRPRRSASVTSRPARTRAPARPCGR